MGVAIVGRIGYEGRLDYTAIGNAVNLASRLCASAEDGQVLVDAVAATAIGDRAPLVPLEGRLLKGYDRELKVYSLRREAFDSAAVAL
jgi:class 3 adenylate cyclase